MFRRLTTVYPHLSNRIYIVRKITAWLTDMDGVLVHNDKALPGSADFINKLLEKEMPFLVLTNNSFYTRRDLSALLHHAGLSIPEDNLWTSASATGVFLKDQIPGGRAYVIGEAGLTTALYEAGLVMTDTKPDVVVLGETRTYSVEAITKAIRLINAGARFIATNPDVTGPSPNGLVPATGAVAAMITAACGMKPYFVGKPNPIMMRAALNRIDAHSEHTALIGDRMDTDIRSGTEAGLSTHLVLTGVTKREDIVKYPIRPAHVHESIADIVSLIK